MSQSSIHEDVFRPIHAEVEDEGFPDGPMVLLGLLMVLPVWFHGVTGVLMFASSLCFVKIDQGMFLTRRYRLVRAE